MEIRFREMHDKVNAMYIFLKENLPCNCKYVEPLIPWLSKQEVMDHLKISRSTYYDWRKRGILEPYQTHGEDRYTPAQINRVILGCKFRERIRGEKDEENL